MLTLDGSMGEGGGQILRTALALSSVTGAPFRIDNLRASRPRPGLARQHLSAVRAAAEVTEAEIEGAELGSTEVTFRPREIRPGEYRFTTGGAGSATLVLQTILPPLMIAPGPSDILLEGGTHNPYAPPFDFVERVFLPLVRRIGPRVDLSLERRGFYPGGGGRLRARIEPATRLHPLTLLDRGPTIERTARVLISSLPRHIAVRELGTLGALLEIAPDAFEVIEVDEAVGPGNVVLIEIRCKEVTEIFTGFGRKGVRAETVAREAAAEALNWESSGALADGHLADQLLVPLALAGGGDFTTTEPTSHTRTNAEVIRHFVNADTTFESLGGGQWLVEIRSRYAASEIPRPGR